jgi:hypothetical protein
MAWVRQLKAHVAFLQQKTVNGNTAYVKRRPATITALGAGELVNLRVLHSGEVYTNVDRRTDPNANAAGTYVSY